MDLPIEIVQAALAPFDLDMALEKECKMVAEDRQEKERIDARNALEEYVYDLRGKISDEDQLATFITEENRESLSRTLDDTENWLYEEGEECNRQVYQDRLSQLRNHGEPIKEIKNEFEGRQLALSELAGTLQIAKKSYDQIKSSKDEKYAHITDEELKSVGSIIKDKWKWLEDAHNVFSTTPRTQMPSITLAQIRTTKQAVDNTVNPIINKPKPKVEPPKDDKKDGKTEEQKNHQNTQDNPATKDDGMDVE